MKAKPFNRFEEYTYLYLNLPDCMPNFTLFIVKYPVGIQHNETMSQLIVKLKLLQSTPLAQELITKRLLLSRFFIEKLEFFLVFMKP